MPTEAWRPRQTNKKLIEAGRAEIHQASVSKLPFPNDQFDLVTAVETQYYWPDLVNDMREILRVLVRIHYYQSAIRPCRRLLRGELT